jgi:hypothetical protein
VQLCDVGFDRQPAQSLGFYDQHKDLAFGNCAGEAKQFPTLGSLSNELAAANQGGNMRRIIWREDKL